MSSSVRGSGIKVNEWLLQSQEIFSVFGLDSLRPKLQEYGNILILKQDDGSFNWTNFMFLLILFLQSPLHLVGTQQPMAPFRVQYKCREWERSSTNSPRFVSPTELLLYPPCSNRFSAIKVLNFNFECCTYSVYAMTVQSYLGSSSWLPASWYLKIKLCCIWNLWAKLLAFFGSLTDTLNSLSKHSGQKAATSGNPAWRFC